MLRLTFDPVHTLEIFCLKKFNVYHTALDHFYITCFRKNAFPVLIKMPKKRNRKGFGKAGDNPSNKSKIEKDKSKKKNKDKHTTYNAKRPKTKTKLEKLEEQFKQNTNKLNDILLTDQKQEWKRKQREMKRKRIHDQLRGIKKAIDTERGKTTNETVQPLTPQNCSTAKIKVEALVSSLPFVEDGTHVRQVFDYLARHTVGTKAGGASDTTEKDTSVVDKLIVDNLVVLLKGMNTHKNKQGALTTAQTTIQELILTVCTQAYTTPITKKPLTQIKTLSRITSRIGLGNKAKRKFNKRVAKRKWQFIKLLTDTTGGLADLVKRAENGDKRELGLSVLWWHSIGSRIDSNGRGVKWVSERDTLQLSKHAYRYFQHTIESGYKDFCTWPPYVAYLKIPGNKPISPCIFKNGRCACMKKKSLRSCVDMVNVQMEKYLGSLQDVIEMIAMKNLRETCTCTACTSGLMEDMCKSLKHLRHLCLCPKEHVSEYDVDGKEATYSYKKECCNRGEGKNMDGPSHKCFQHKFVCKQYHCEHKKGEPNVPLCTECGIEKLVLCPHFETEDIKINVSEYGEVERENKWKNDEMKTVRMSVKELIEKIVGFAPCYFSHYWELNHDMAVDATARHRMVDIVNGYVDIIINADFASTFSIPSDNDGVCNTRNNMNTEMFCIARDRRRIWIPPRTYGKKTKPGYWKIIWTNGMFDVK